MKLLPIAAVLAPLASGAWAQPQPTPPTPSTASAAPAAPQTQPIAPMDESKRVSADDIDKLLAEGKVLLLDVREPKEREELGAIEDSVNIPIGQLEKRLDELPKDRLILTA
jgi:3-mercaptopyruvate sulfurtransferase SseA